MSHSAMPARPVSVWGAALNRRRLRRAIQFFIGPAVLIALWWVAYAGTLVDANLLPSPFATLADTSRKIASGAMNRDLVQTLLRVAYAFAIATCRGVPAGIILGANQDVYRSFEFIIDF